MLGYVGVAKTISEAPVSLFLFIYLIIYNRNV